MPKLMRHIKENSAFWFFALRHSNKEHVTAINKRPLTECIDFFISGIKARHDDPVFFQRKLQVRYWRNTQSPMLPYCQCYRFDLLLHGFLGHIIKFIIAPYEFYFRQVQNREFHILRQYLEHLSHTLQFQALGRAAHFCSTGQGTKVGDFRYRFAFILLQKVFRWEIKRTGDGHYTLYIWYASIFILRKRLLANFRPLGQLRQRQSTQKSRIFQSFSTKSIVFHFRFSLKEALCPLFILQLYKLRANTFFNGNQPFSRFLRLRSFFRDFGLLCGQLCKVRFDKVVQ